MRRIFLKMGAIAGLGLLAACNGGGGSSGSGGTPPPPGPDLQTSVPAPEYGPDGLYRSATFNDINTLRASLGLGLLAQSAVLDTAAANHMEYYGPPTGDLVQGRVLEDPQAGSSRFTGVTPQDRCDHAGYPGSCPLASQWGGSLVRRADPYTALLLLTQGAREMGLSDRRSHFLLTIQPFIQLGYPIGSTPQRQGAVFLLATALGGAFHVHVKEGESLTVDSFRVWDNLGNELPGTVITQANDPLPRVPGHAALFMPAGLSACDASHYSLAFSGKRNGTPFSVHREVTFWQGGEGACY